MNSSRLQHQSRAAVEPDFGVGDAGAGGECAPFGDAETALNGQEAVVGEMFGETVESQQYPKDAV